MYDGDTKVIQYFGHKILRQGPIRVLKSRCEKNIKHYLGRNMCQGVNGSRSGQEPNEDFCERDDERSVPYKQGTFLTAEKLPDFQ
jgi:hypothetical protein